MFPKQPFLLGVFLALLGVFFILLHIISKSQFESVKGINIEKTETTKEEAEKRVSSLPEVKRFLTNDSSRGRQFTVSADENRENPNHWLVQVAEIVPGEGEDGHTATFNWYEVDKVSGSIICSMFPYDNNGKLITSDENNSIPCY